MSEHLWAKVAAAGPDECWPWIGNFRTNIVNGARLKYYGQYRAKQAHRVVYERVYGPIPPKYVVDHTCDNKACCNPNHLEAVTNGENMRRAHARKKDR